VNVVEGLVVLDVVSSNVKLCDSVADGAVEGSMTEVALVLPETGPDVAGGLPPSVSAAKPTEGGSARYTVYTFFWGRNGSRRAI
jgi:hypothetical protein